jgi:hypothetical protein
MCICFIFVVSNCNVFLCVPRLIQIQSQRDMILHRLYRRFAHFLQWRSDADVMLIRFHFNFLWI